MHLLSAALISLQCPVGLSLKKRYRVLYRTKHLLELAYHKFLHLHLVWKVNILNLIKKEDFPALRIDIFPNASFILQNKK